MGRCPLSKLTRFKIDLLYAIARAEARGERPHGLGVKHALEGKHERINHGQLYPALDDLVDRGFIEKDDKDGRTNEYGLTAAGRTFVREDAKAKCECLNALTSSPPANGP